MSVKEEIVIQDTCILLDLVDLKLLEGFFQLELIVMTTPQVTAEVTDDVQWQEISVYINSGRLSVDGKGDLNAIVAISKENPGLTFTDSSVLELALRKPGMVLSSDGSLKKSCERAGIEVHGVLWVIEALCKAGILSADQGCGKLREYERVNSRAPKDDIQVLINNLESSTKN